MHVADPKNEMTTEAIASELIDALDRTVLLSPLSARFPDLDLAAAYAVGAEITRRRRARGERTIGRKLGFTNQAYWSALGVDAPFWAHIYDCTVAFFDNSEGSVSIGRLAQPRLEPEIVLHFRSAPPTTAGEAELVTHIDWIAFGYEIVQCHFPDWSLQTVDVISDFGVHGALVVGPPLSVAELADPVETLRNFTITLARDGVEQAHGGGANVLGSPLRALATVVTATKDLPGSEPIQAGEIVTTGTLTSFHAVQAGDTWSAEPAGIGLDGLRVQIRS